MSSNRPVRGHISDVRVTKGYANSWRCNKPPCECYGAIKLILVILVIAIALTALPLAIAVGSSIYEEGQRTHLPPVTKPQSQKPEGA